MTVLSRVTCRHLITIAALLLGPAFARGESAPQVDRDTYSDIPSGSMETNTPSQSGSSSRRLRSVLYSRTELGVASLHDNAPDATTIYRVGPRYRIADETSVAVMQEFETEFARNVRGQMTMRDLFVQLISDNVATLPDRWMLSVRGKEYLPTGPASVALHREGTEVFSLFETKTLHRWVFEAENSAYYYNETEDSYRKGKKNISLDDHEIDNYFSVTYRFTESFEVFHAAGLELNWQRPMPGEGIARHSHVSNETGFTYQFSKQLKMILSICNDPEMDAQNAFTLYGDADTVYRAVFMLKI